MVTGRHAVIWCGLVATALGLGYMAAVYQGAGHAFAKTAVQMDELLTWLLG